MQMKFAGPELPVATESSYYLDLYTRYLRDRNSVPADWRHYFETTQIAQKPEGGRAGGGELVGLLRRSSSALAHLDPLTGAPPELPEEIARHGELAGSELLSLYRGPFTIEADHMEKSAERDWLYGQLENRGPASTGEDRARWLRDISLAHEFESVIGTRYPTKKRFGIEGAETLIVLLREILRDAALQDYSRIIVGGMHRGRLSTLAVAFEKDLPTLVHEILGKVPAHRSQSFTGDVPYHNGLERSLEIEGRSLGIKVLPHPSHLSVVAPVAIGAASGAQRKAGDKTRILPLVLHTDAAFAGQGVISEMLQLGGIASYDVGGAIHLVVNNQIGFTTLPSEGRRTRHPTDVAKAYDLPVLHVNANYPEAVVRAAHVAMAWRARFAKDILVNFVCYRRNGHNELDEPRFTQPLFWQKIDALAPIRTSWRAQVEMAHPDTLAAVDREVEDFRRRLLEALDQGYSALKNEFAPETGEGAKRDGETALGAETMELIAPAFDVPAGNSPHSKVEKFYTSRRQSALSERRVNMATAEYLAFAASLLDGISVRASGQDYERGTFTQRHLAVHDRNTGDRLFPLKSLESGKVSFLAFNSPLTEYATLSFEYGYSLERPDDLVVWEAQFGDFLNGAQIVVDQYITTAHSKWEIESRLVISLPHGQEGQGPDHSSARIERIMQTATEDNIRVVNPSTPANLFHVLRRQVKAAQAKPLFLISPKSLLRNPACLSDLSEFGPGSAFRPLIEWQVPEAKVRKLVLCSGKIVYDLKAALAAEEADDVALVSFEQLNPFPRAEIEELLARLQPAELVWCQEEPQNQGAYLEIARLLEQPDLAYVGRKAIAAAAGGYVSQHEEEQARIVRDAIA